MRSFSWFRYNLMYFRHYIWHTLHCTTLHYTVLWNKFSFFPNIHVLITNKNKCLLKSVILLLKTKLTYNNVNNNICNLHLGKIGELQYNKLYKVYKHSVSKFIILARVRQYFCFTIRGKQRRMSTLCWPLRWYLHIRHRLPRQSINATSITTSVCNGVRALQPVSKLDQETWLCQTHMVERKNQIQSYLGPFQSFLGLIQSYLGQIKSYLGHMQLHFEQLGTSLLTETDRNWQKQTKIDRNGQKRTETDRNRQKWTV